MASLPWAVAHGVQGFRGLSSEVKGSYRDSCGSPRVFPTSGRKGKKKSLVHRAGVGQTGGAM